VLEGDQGAPRDAVLLNAGAGIYAAGAADSIREGVALAAAAIDSGRSRERLNQLIALTQELAAVAAQAEPA
jgi:anthranilate phosphoribosyltransferase